MTPDLANGLSAADSAATVVPYEISQVNGVRSRRLLLTNGCVITMDPKIGDFPRADVLIEGNRIAAIGPDLRRATEQPDLVIDATDMIVVPGFVDTHRHMWQGQLRRMLPNVEFPVYLGLRNALAVQYRPEDTYAGTLVNALGALNAGVTTVLDLSHNTRTSRHADAGVDALEAAGIRAIFAYAPPEAGDWDRQWPDDLARIKGERFDDDGDMLTLRMAQRCVSDVDNLTGERIRVARDLGIGMTVDPVAWEEGSERILALAGEDLLGPDLAFVHCSDLSDNSWKAMAASEVKVSLSPFVDELLGFDTHADRLPTVQRAIDVGIAPGLSVDIETTVPGDMFTQMRALLAVQRMRASLGNPGANRPQLTVRDTLAFATIHGAETVGLSHVCGSLSPGKKADIVMIDQAGASSFPLNNAYGAVVMGADTSAVRCVFVDGVIRKWGHSLVDVDIAGARSLIERSRDYLLSEVGYHPDLFIDYPTLDLGPPRFRP